jgi:hypothetical protein
MTHLDHQSMVAHARDGGGVIVAMPGGGHIRASLIYWAPTGKRARVRFLNGSERSVPKTAITIGLQ